MAHVLIVDTDTSSYRVLGSLAAERGHRVTPLSTADDVLRTVKARPVDVVFLNNAVDDGKGIELIPEIIKTPSSPEVIILSDAPDPEEAAKAIESGAWEYLYKKSSHKILLHHLEQALQYRAHKVERAPLYHPRHETFSDIIGTSPQMRACIDLIAQASKGDAHVLIVGETGTGKELSALALHNNSNRADKNFVVVDCAALPENLVESILFGYEKGAFTGADAPQDGLVQQADGGTLFLDEVGELPPSVQKSFLRVLQEKSFRKVGGRKQIRSDFRIICASNRDLDELVEKKRFREDLLFRLRAFTVKLPPLRERKQDIPELVLFRVAKLYRDLGIEQKEFSSDFFDVLTQYGWPGNVRELFNAIDRAVTAAQSEPVLFPKHLPINIRARLARARTITGAEPDAGPREADRRAGYLPTIGQLRKQTVEEAEQSYLRELMSITEGDIGQACRISGLSKSRLYALLKRYSITPSW
jgi:two-component system NtrC family response regulator